MYCKGFYKVIEASMRERERDVVKDKGDKSPEVKHVSHPPCSVLRGTGFDPNA